MNDRTNKSLQLNKKQFEKDTNFIHYTFNIYPYNKKKTQNISMYMNVSSNNHYHHICFLFMKEINIVSDSLTTATL